MFYLLCLGAVMVLLSVAAMRDAATSAKRLARIERGRQR
jgi:hypothetical protein